MDLRSLIGSAGAAAVAAAAASGAVGPAVSAGAAGAAGNTGGAAAAAPVAGSGDGKRLSQWNAAPPEWAGGPPQTSPIKYVNHGPMVLQSFPGCGGHVGIAGEGTQQENIVRKMMGTEGTVPPSGRPLLGGAFWTVDGDRTDGSSLDGAAEVAAIDLTHDDSASTAYGAIAGAESNMHGAAWGGGAHWSATGGGAQMEDTHGVAPVSVDLSKFSERGGPALTGTALGRSTLGHENANYYWVADEEARLTTLVRRPLK